jgi:hypothetical protein
MLGTDDITSTGPPNNEDGSSRGDQGWRRPLLAAAAVVLLAGAVGLFVLVSGDDEDSNRVVTDTPTTATSLPPTTGTPDTTEQSADDGQLSVGTAAETWASPEQRESSPQVLPWHGGFVVVPVEQGSLDQVWVSDDGSVWERVQLDDPFGAYPTDLDRPSIGRVVSDGEHLVVARLLSNSQRQERDGTEAVQIAATDDLSSWEIWNFTPDLPRDLPSVTSPYFELRAVDVTDRGWAAMASLSFIFDLASLFPPEIGPITGHAVDANGITGTTTDADGIGTAGDVFLTWDDVGIDYETYLEYSSGAPVQTVTRAAWGEDLTVSPGPRWEVFGLSANERGALASSGSTLEWTDDWQTWDEVPAPPAATTGWTEFASVPSGVILAGRSGIWIGGPDGSDWRPVELSRLEGRTIWPLERDDRAARSEGFAIIADVADYGDGFPGWADPRMPPPDTPPELVIIASPDGERWLVEDLELGPEPELETLYELSATISGDRVLVHNGTEVTIHEIP